MGIEHKKNAGTYMGEPESRGAQREGSGKPVSGNFKKGSPLKGLPDQSDDYPKAGKGQADSFKMLRMSDISKGSI